VGASFSAVAGGLCGWLAAADHLRRALCVTAAPLVRVLPGSSLSLLSSVHAVLWCSCSLSVMQSQVLLSLLCCGSVYICCHFAVRMFSRAP